MALMGCGSDPVPQAPSKQQRRRVSKNDTATLLKRVEKTKREACACADQACADRAMSHLYAFSTRSSGMRLSETDEASIVRVAQAGIACAKKHLSD